MDNPLNNILFFPTAKLMRARERQTLSCRVALRMYAQGPDAHYVKCTHIDDQPFFYEADYVQEFEEDFQ
jgi:hypothetical protein